MIFDNTYARLPVRMFSEQLPTPVSSPALIRVNGPLAEQLGFDPAWLASDEGVAFGAGNHMPEGTTPIATVYAGHQFGNWNPQLGDGRAILLGEVVDANGHRFDVQLKGSGPTRYSRGGDGRAPLGPVIREYVLSEAMYALGVPTTRSLLAVTTGEPVYRDYAEPGAVLTRVASSHIRVGTFQYFASRSDSEALQLLCDQVISRHFPDAADAERPVLAMLEAAIDAQAALVAKWQALGFIHGVMNTDNMLLCGETVDYGPCAFMDNYKSDMVYSSIDVGGRYAYRNQPGIAQWNLMGLAQAVLALIDDDEETAISLAKGVLEEFPNKFLNYHKAEMLAKLGLPADAAEGEALVRDLLEVMETASLDFTVMFRQLTDHLAESADLPAELEAWREGWLAALPQDRSAIAAEMGKVNPIYVPRNHAVEAAIRAAVDEGDFDVFHQLVEILEDPYTPHADAEWVARGPHPDEIVSKTFCGT